MYGEIAKNKKMGFVPVTLVLFKFHFFFFFLLSRPLRSAPVGPNLFPNILGNGQVAGVASRRVGRRCGAGQEKESCVDVIFRCRNIPEHSLRLIE